MRTFPFHLGRHPGPSRPARGIAGFTLLEMLAVLGVFLLALAMVLPGLNGVLDGRTLDAATAQAASDLRLARQQAITANRDVIVRIYEIPEGAGWAMRGYQSFLPDTGGAAPRALSAATFLPPGVRFSTQADETTLLTLPGQTPDAAAPALPPPVARNYRYRTLLFRANGTPLRGFCLTLRPMRGSAPGRTIAIDEATGRITVFTP